MITGFNTDIEHEGVTYHVQTEDKGRSKPVILSLVYNGGTILASKRSPYDDLLRSDFSERELAERLSKQHRLICAAIQAGRIEDLKKLTAREAALAKPAHTPIPGHVNAVASATAAPLAGRAPLPIQMELGLPKPVSVPLDEFRPTEKPIPKPNIGAGEDLDDVGLLDELIIEAVAVFEDDDEFIMLPAEAVAVIEEPLFPERRGHNKLCIEILGDVRFRGGERNSVGFLVSRGSGRKVVPGAQIMVKILGSSFRPVIFHAQTDANGVATVNVQMPNFTSGRAAFLVRAISDGEEIELRRSIAHG